MARKIKVFDATVDSVKKQLDQAEAIKQLNKKIKVQHVPLSSINLDKNNSRKLSIGIAEVKDGPKISVDSMFDDAAQKEYEAHLNDFYDANDSLRDTKIKEHLDLAILASSIRTPENLDNPITVVKIGTSSTFDLVSGERRTLAHYIFDAEFIVISLKKFDDFQKAENQYIENAQNKQLKFSEKWSAVKRLIKAKEDNTSIDEDDNFKVSKSSITSLLSVDSNTGGCWSTIYKGPEDVVEAIESGVIEALRIAASIARISDDSDRQSAIENIKNDASIKKENKKQRPKKEKSTRHNFLNVGVRTGTKSKAFHAILKAALYSEIMADIREEALENFSNSDPKTIAEMADFMYENIKEKV